MSVNGSKSGTWVLLEDQGVLYAPRVALIEWRLPPPANRPPLYFRKVEYYALDGIAGYTAKADFANQSVEINFAPTAFGETRYGAGELKRPLVGTIIPSAYLNYEINYQRYQTPGSQAQQNTGLLGEAGFSSAIGLLATSFLGRYSDSESSTTTPRLQRLETYLTKDFHESNHSLRIGDSSTRQGMLGNSLYYGGIRFGTDFSLTPGFISQALPIGKGVSSTPSTVELYVNDVLRQTTQVGSGPFTLENIPPTSGAGDIRMVVRDIFGRESVITRSFFSSNRLLAEGLSDWSIESGRIRHDLGSPTAHYGEFFSRGIIRHGINENLTLEGLGEGTAKQKNIQFGGSTPITHWLASGALAVSQTADTGVGYRWLASLEQARLRYGIALQAIGATERYRTLASNSPPIRYQFSGNLSYTTVEFGSFGLSAAALQTFDGHRIATQSAYYSLRVGDRGTLSFNLSRSEGGDYRGKAAGMTLIIPFDKGPTTFASINRRDAVTDFYTSATENPNPNSPFGWRALVGRQQNVQREETGISCWDKRFRMVADASHDDTGANVQRLSLASSLVVAGGNLFALRDSRESLALVEVPGYPNIRVGMNNAADRRTDENGVALVPNLLAFQENSITLNAQDLPISAELNSLEQIAVPGRRSVVHVRFPVRQGRGALLRIHLDADHPVPAGAIVRIQGETQEFVVARRGEVFVTGLQEKNRLIVTHPGGECAVTAEVSQQLSPHKISRLGPLACQGLNK